jgi:hypothetical protein
MLSCVPKGTLACRFVKKLYIYFVENWGALKINNYEKKFISIYNSRLFEESQLKCLKLNLSLFQKPIITNDIT